ncbi:zinc finger CCCH domain-containing protein 6-like isoform X2 [Phalaenopsis equestris]|uniref:zinc finger CCCH domain-containing protein 6-like isoform X2 n=1 Tax=Phalaenopsis equestris TaxID=78828 RepID=UPI0009E45827|nr:zinc finger CCCH domain-containing protein 6-like isoform X2 [Phalaenopsis equestris]
MDPYGGDGHQPDPDSGLQESMWRLELGGGGNRGGGLPERPGKRDCAYYLRTGTCGYGERCRYHHPLDRVSTVAGPARLVAGEYPERYGQPFCEYFLKTGTCKFGSSCKYHHPRQGDGSVQLVLLNSYGYPLRPGEEECSYFMKTGKCKFGLTCKFHHPQTTSASMPSPAPVFYPMVPTTSIATPQQYPEVGVWQVGRSSSALSGAYMPSSYGPVLFSPRVLPVPGWNAYPTPINESASSGAQQSTQVEPLYWQHSQLSSSASAYSGSYPLVTSLVGPSTNNNQIEQNLPQRPGQPECQFFMRTGQCKFGAACRYHHPPNWSITATNCSLNPLGLPLRPVMDLGKVIDNSEMHDSLYLLKENNFIGGSALCLLYSTWYLQIRSDMQIRSPNQYIRL